MPLFLRWFLLFSITQIEAQLNQLSLQIQTHQAGEQTSQPIPNIYPKAQSIRASDIAYQWQWQMGRIIQTGVYWP
ncbi:MAG: hypothetical protein QNJ46_28675 [Leptolyngbyaceae cyanobacterium MO_188.B28]|nr:hypothetical protein [Leptolyngbyaceae cyanobacterium MO_188.B28]